MKTDQFPINGDQIASFNLLKSALDSNITGIIITDNRLPDNPIIYCNKAFEVLSGYHRVELIGRNCRFLQGRERDQKAREKIREAIVKGDAIITEIRNYKRTGELFWNELHISPIKDEAGNVTHFVGVQNDVTRRKNAEENLIFERKAVEQKVKARTDELKANEEYLDGIVQTIRQGLLVLDPDLNVISANDFFFRTFKVGNRDTVGKKLYELGNGQWNIAGLRILLEQLLPTNNPVLDFEVEHDFPHIGKKLMLLNAHRIELNGKYRDRILLAIEDITEYRAAEIRKDEFLSVSSHELKTPLTTIKGYYQTLYKLIGKDLSPKALNIFEKTGQQIERLQRINGDLLDMSRIETGNLEIHKENLDFDQLISDVVNESRNLFPSHQILVQGKLGKTILGDESQLVQVLHNLISNAIKYSPNEKKINIHVSEVSNFAKLSVTDYGLGIAMEDQKRIFDRFYRASDIQKHFPGMGVGLYISEQIILHHGGTLWVDSEPGKGATFSFTLPIATGKADHE